MLGTNTVPTAGDGDDGGDGDDDDQAVMEAKSASAGGSGNVLQLNWSHLEVPMGRRCAGLAAWEFLNALNTSSITHVDLNCAGLKTLDLEQIESMRSSLVEIDLSNNAWETKGWGTTPCPSSVCGNVSGVVAGKPISKLWATLATLGSLKSFAMESASLGDEHFSLANAIFINESLVAPHTHTSFDAFRVAGNRVLALEWSTAITEHALRPPLWLAMQLASSLQTILLNGQQYEGSGSDFLHALCSASGSLSQFQFSMAFRATTIIPPCFWQLTSLHTLISKRDFKDDRELRSDLKYEFRIGGQMPASLEHMTNLYRFALGDDNVKNGKYELVGDGGHLIHGSLPLLPAGMKWLEIVSMKNVSGQIPVEYCQNAALSTLRIQGTSIRGPVPSCLGGVNNTALSTITLTDNPLLGGPLPWGAWFSPRRRGAARIRIMRLYKNDFVGPALPADFPDDCSLTRVTLSGNTKLTGPVPNNITKCRHLEWLHMHKMNLTGQLPVSLCGMCALESLRFDENPNLELIPGWDQTCKDLFCGRVLKCPDKADRIDSFKVDGINNYERERDC